MDRLDMRAAHQHQEVSPDEIRAIVEQHPEGKGTDRPSNRNTRWFAQVAQVKSELQRLAALMLPSGNKLESMRDEDMPLRDLYKRYYVVRNRMDTQLQYDVEGLIETRMEEVQAAATTCKDRLQAMKAEIDQFRAELGAEYSGCEVKMRETMHGSLCKRLHKLVREYQAMQLERKEQHKKSIMQQVKLVLRGDKGARADEQELDDAVEQCMADGDMPFQKIQHGGAQWHKAQDTLNDVREKHADIVKLERGITELAEMFNDLAVLVAAQGEIIDRIEVNVGNTHSYTESAVRDLSKANSYGHANRKKMCCIVWLGMCIICFMLGPVLPFLLISRR